MPSNLFFPVEPQDSSSGGIPDTRTISTTSPLQGGGDLSANRTLSISAATAMAAGSMSAADKSKLDGLPSSAVPTTRTLTAGTGLTGGGDLSADRTLAVSFGTSSTTVCVGNDSRLSDARTPLTHASTHASGGSDPVSLAASQITSGTLTWARLPTLLPGITIPYQTVYTTASRWVTVLATQYGSTSSGTSTRTDAYHLLLPANTTWRLDMITSYSYGGGGTLSAVVETASAWAGTYSQAAIVSTTSGGINNIFTTTLAVGGSAQVAVFRCAHSSAGINNVITRFYQVG